MSVTSRMSNKVAASAKVGQPTGDLGSYPQRTAPNPSQANGSNPPTLRPRAMSGHMSPEVRADTGKLTPELRAGLLKAADAK
jgi:hypothetical protein